jgi:transcriptional regulator with XRE-family HTH domain
MTTRFQKTRNVRRFSSARYLEELMGELDRAAISARLQESRDTAGITQAEMGEILSVHENTIQNWESVHKGTVPFDRLDEWAAVANTTKRWLLHGEEGVEVSPEDLAEIRSQIADLRATTDLIEQLLRSVFPGDQEPPADR